MREPVRAINSDPYGPVTAQLLQLAQQAGLPRTLPFGAAEPTARPVLETMTAQNLSKNRRVRMPSDADALCAGLWLLFDYMDEAHTLAQNIATPDGSYWHAIVHRREPDADNARYWFARVGDHPIFAELLADTQQILQQAGAPVERIATQFAAQGAWDPGLFIDLCTRRQDAPTTAALLAIQRREWDLLFSHCFRKAFAGI